jgi:hypothetical protein
LRQKIAVITAILVVASLFALLIQVTQGKTGLQEFASSVELVRIDLKHGRELENKYSVTISGSEYSLTPAQLLYYASDAIVRAEEGGKFSIDEPISVAAPDNEKGIFEASLKKLSKSDYVGLAREIRDEIDSTGKAPGSVQTPIGRMRFRDVLFTFTRILSGGDGLPSEVIFVPAPSGNLDWGGVEIPANYACYLLPSRVVVTNGSAANEVLSKIVGNIHNPEELARRLCAWTSTNITYVFLVGRTSEEVLASREGQCGDFMNVYLALARRAGIPARGVSGRIVLTQEYRPPPGFEALIVGTTPEGENIASHGWAEVFLPENGWVPVDPTIGSFGELPYRVYTQLRERWMDALAAYETEYGTL